MKIHFKDRTVIKKHLIINGMSQREFSKQINTSEQYLSQVLNDRKQLSPKTAKKISEVMNIGFQQLFDIKE